MLLMSKKKHAELREEIERLSAVKRRADVLDASCGIGLWDAVLCNADAMHPESVWTWSSEFRRLLGFSSRSDFPDVVHSWSDRLHPDDAPPTFAAFAKSLEDTSGRCSYDVEYRMKMRNGDFRWFRATGGCKLDVNGRIHACGSFSDIHEAKVTQGRIESGAGAAREFFAAMSEALERLADGDLGAVIDAELQGQYAAIKATFNEAVGRMRDALIEVAQASDNIRDGTRQINSASDDLSRRLAEQAASIVQTSAAMGEIAGTVKRTAEGSQRAAAATAAARLDAEKSGEVVRQTVQAMGEIEGSAKQISQIIGVIDEIAFQTNLLALNAGVEAARAGDAGRGFAVVASEVRALAQRSAEAAREIKGLISASTSHVAKGVGLVDSTGKTLQNIIAKAAEAADLVSAISSSAQAQAGSIDQINDAVSQMGQLTQANAAMVVEAAASNRSLRQDAEQMETLVGKFTLRAEARRPEPAPAPASAHGRAGAIRRASRAAA